MLASTTDLPRAKGRQISFRCHRGVWGYPSDRVPCSDEGYRTTDNITQNRPLCHHLECGEELSLLLSVKPLDDRER